MRPVSKARQKLMRQMKPIRDAFRSEVGCCEVCGKTTGALDVHEIGRGTCRALCLGARCALLVLCRRCHDKLGSTREWPESRQLAILARRRPRDFDLTAYLKITSPHAMRRITIEEVLEFMEEEYLTKSDVAEKMQVDRRSVQNWIDSGELPAIDCRTAGASRPLYRVAWGDYLEFCKTRRLKTQ